MKGPRARRVVCVLLAVLAATSAIGAVGAVGTVGAEEAALEKRLSAARKRLVSDLAALAGWTLGQGLDARREETLLFVLDLDPDHAEARRALGWTRKKDGPWVAPRPRTAPVDARPARLPARQARWTAAFETYRDAVLPSIEEGSLLDRPEARLEALSILARGLPDDAGVCAALARVARTLRDATIPSDALERLDDLLDARFPDDARVRAARGHVRAGGAWVLEETARGRERRAALAARTKEALAAAPPAKSAEVAPEEAASGLPNLRAWGTASRRAVGTLDDQTLSKVAFHLERAADVFSIAFGQPLERPPPATSWQVRDLAEARQVVSRVFRGGEKLLEEMKAYSTLPLGAVEVVWSTEADAVPWRVDSALFGVQERQLSQQHGLGERYEAFSQGLARYLVWRQVGTRHSSVLDRSYSDPVHGLGIGDLGLPAFDWAKATVALLRPHKNRGFLRLALGKRAESQTRADALCCYAFAAYLFEGHEGGHKGGHEGGQAGGHEAAAARLATRMGREQNDDLDAAFRQVFGWSVDQVERRLSRWCQEMAP